MEDRQDILHLNDGERVLGIIKKSTVVSWPKLIFGMFFVLIPFFFFFPLLQLGGFGIGLFVILSASGAIFLIRVWMSMKFTMILATTQRLIDIAHTGIFGREISEIELGVVSSVRVRKRSFFGRIFNVGSIVIQTSNTAEFDMEFSGVRNPHIARQFLLDVCKLNEKENQNTSK